MNTPKHATDEQISTLWDASKEIDLRGKNLEMRYEFHGSFRGVRHWSCWDAKAGPDSLTGRGESQEEALVDFLERL